jgi:antitoxin CptB
MMTGTNLSSAGLDARRAKALFRSWHRGMREVDLILGDFADAEIASLTDAELDQYEELLGVPDGDLLRWVTGERPVPDSRHEADIGEPTIGIRLKPMVHNN